MCTHKTNSAFLLNTDTKTKGRYQSGSLLYWRSCPLNISLHLVQGSHLAGDSSARGGEESLDETKSASD